VSRPLQIVFSFFASWILVVAPVCSRSPARSGRSPRRRIWAAAGCRRPALRAVLPMLCEIGTAPEKGDTFRLRVDPKNPKRIALEPSSLDDG